MRIIPYNNCDNCDAKNASVDCRGPDWRQFDAVRRVMTRQFELQLKYYKIVQKINIISGPGLGGGG